MIDIAVDGLRVAHMAAFAVGIGAATFLESQLLRRFSGGIDAEGLKTLIGGHKLIRNALLALWITGLGLLYVKIFVLCLGFTAKLGVKLGVVMLLTGNMLLIERYLIPEMSAREGVRLRDIPQAVLGRFGAVAGFSAGCWGSALLLGGIGRFRTMEAFEVLGVILPLVIAATIAGAVAAMVVGYKPNWPRAVLIPNP
jgi:hypothetical protein